MLVYRGKIVLTVFGK